MAVIKANSGDVRLLARLMRAEAEGDGEQGMLLVGNVGVNRVLADCLDFGDIRDINRMVFQNPGGFESTQKGYFYQRARQSEIRLAQRVINGERIWPASNSLWFFRPAGNVRQPGITSRIQVVSKRIVSSVQQAKTVRVYFNFRRNQYD